MHEKPKSLKGRHKRNNMFKPIVNNCSFQTRSGLAESGLKDFFSFMMTKLKYRLCDQKGISPVRD